MRSDTGPKARGISSAVSEFAIQSDPETLANGAKNGTKGDQVVSALRAYIAGGEIGPGEKISLRKLAAALDVSVMPVRNAVARLQSDGVLDVEPGRAVRVRKMTADQFRELTAIRLEIEGFAAYHAALRRKRSDLKTVSELSAAFEKLAIDTSKPATEASRVNMQFHFAVYRAANMPMLLDIIERLWLKAGPVVFHYIHLERFPWPTNAGIELHKLAVEAMRDKDGEAARAAIAKDIQMASDRLLASDIFDK